MASHLDRVLPAAAQDGVLQNVRQSRVVRRGGPPHTPEYCVEGPPPVPPHPNGMGSKRWDEWILQHSHSLGTC